MAIILPKEGSIWETLGSGLGSGLSALAQGKVQQMQKRNYAGSLQQMGFSPDIAYLPENLQPLAIQQHYKGLEALKQKNAAEEMSAMAKDVYGVDLSPEFLSTKQGQQYLSQIQKGEQQLDIAQQKAALKPYSMGEAALAALGNYTPERAQPRVTLLEKQQIASEKQSARKALKKIKSLSSQDRADLKAAGKDIDAMEQQLKQLLSSPSGKLQFESGQIGQAQQQGFGATQEQPMGMERQTQPAAGMLPYAASAGIGALKSGLAITPPFLGQTAYNFGSGLLNLLSRSIGTGKQAPTYEEVSEGLSKMMPGQQEAIEKGRSSNSFLERIAGASLASPINTGLPPSAEQVVGAVQELAKGTSLEPYVIPQTPGQQKAEDIGGLIPIFAGGSIGSAQGILGKSKEIAKATAKAYGAKAAGDFTKIMTGSEKAGNAITFGLTMAHSLYPGSFENNANRLYDDFRNRVINNPKAQGKSINPLEYNDKLTKMERLSKNYAKGSEERKAFDTQLNKLQYLGEEGGGKISPEALWNNIKSTGKSASKAPETVRGDISQLVDFQKDMLLDFARKVDPKGAESLIEANNVFRSGMEAKKVGDKIASSIFPKQLSAGTAAFILGAGMPKILALALGYKQGKGLQLLLKNDSIRNNMYKLAKESIAGNMQAANILAKKIDTKVKEVAPEYVSVMERYRELEPSLK